MERDRIGLILNIFFVVTSELANLEFYQSTTCTASFSVQRLISMNTLHGYATAAP